MKRLLLVLAACGGAPAPVAPVPPTPKPADKPALPPAVVSALADVRLYVATVDGLELFPEEQLAAQQVIAAWARSEGLTVEDPARTAQILARAEAGQHVTTGKACGAPLYAFEAHQRWRAELAATGKIEARVSCDPDCVLQVSLSIGTEGERGTEFFAAPFDPKRPWRTELAARLPTLVDNGGHDRHGHLNNPVAIAGIARSGGDMIADDAQHLDDAAARACFTFDRATQVQVEYGDTGAVARCTAVAGHWAVSAPCVCRALATHTGTPHTRERFDAFAPSPPPTHTTDGLLVIASSSAARIPDGDGTYKPLTTDPAIEMWEPPDRDRLAPCFADLTGDAKIKARATVDFDADGQPTKSIVVATTGTLTPAQQQCVRDEFLRIRAPCPSTPKSSATAEIDVSLAKP